MPGGSYWNGIASATATERFPVLGSDVLGVPDAPSMVPELIASSGPQSFFQTISVTQSSSLGVPRSVIHAIATFAATPLGVLAKRAQPQAFTTSVSTGQLFPSTTLFPSS